ncbi:MAG: 4-phosphoerythronate dehydrogenase [Prolixibacteraceae bacterium]|nr:4-phosphoerythronate dehydrogenase [Prolixibacteraceae bacterium]
MKVIIDDKIPYIKGALEPFAEVLYLPGKETTPGIVKDADAIITRTRTICNEKLLAGSKVSMIATATIGFDHIDTDYCKESGIEWTNAPGCNSWSVAQYIMAALYTLASEKKFSLVDKTIGIVGAGNVGSKVEKLCRIIGMRVLVNDPPRERKEGGNNFVDIETIKRESDLITFHTPLTFEGEDKTFHILNDSFLKRCKDNVYIINAARGEISDTQSIIDGLKSGKINEIIFDCWEKEPDINRELLNKAFISTPHIAGYSRDGKANGTSMSIQAISRKFNLGIDNWKCPGVETPEDTIIYIDGSGKSTQEIIGFAILKTYPILEDSERLKNSPETFEKQRGDYPVRREFPVYKCVLSNCGSKISDILKDLGFQVS